MSEQSQEPVDATAVEDFLRRNPQFFRGREELLAELSIPHPSGAAVSLVERQLGLLRERNHELRGRLGHLMEVARDNDRLFDKTRRLVLDLLDAITLEEAVGLVEDSLRHEFQIPFVGLILFGEHASPAGRWVDTEEALQAIGGLLACGKPLCGVLRSHELGFLFGEERRPQIGSAAVAALDHQGLHGVLAVGSPDPQHYRSSLGTLFLGYIADVLARLLPRLASSPLRPVR
ncbi:DUF484 family protein [Azotobacter chroococcum]|jgi:uncharacterized protein YigA (DUF484 family)|uniref:DUF484 family protein n=1 Tax=Azotobacter chroococcum TaxID=353 RepID=A0A4V2KTW1_9GAMM|nr:DUF484 family protein [Azotobacter chroococcum]ASL28186.1 hypothetical protein ACG10_19105 [Azotobacter chroococcum]MEE4463392.1 DUF484 family protein [Azotobacter chroococcum]NHN78631.1 DUF484 family protein [Azotobacter chroococcum]QQE88490.1 DUF484 family protein [Azotobacter chroococcum]TBW07022.1 DUF484 family protein [Azotobacter chroococcum subsp. isscasi]